MRFLQIALCPLFLFAMVFCGAAPSFAAERPKDALKPLAAGVELYKKGDFEGALKEFMAAREKLPEDADLLYYIGMSYMKLNEPERAAEFFGRAAELRPDFTDAEYQLGMSLALTKDYKEAIPHLEKVYAVQPSRENLGYLLGLSHYETGDYEKALKYLEANKTGDAKIKSLALYYAGLAKVRLGRAEEAEVAYKELINIDPTSPLAPSSQRFVEVIQEAARVKKPYKIQFTTKFQYDTNVRLAPTLNQITYTNGVPFEPEGRHKSTAEFIYLSGEYAFYKTRNAEAKASYSFLQTVNNSVQGKNEKGNSINVDFQDHILSLSGTYRTAFLKMPVYLIGTYSTDYALLRYDGYLARHTLRPSVTVVENKNNMTLLQHTVQVKNFLDAPSTPKADRDAVSNETGLVHYLRAASGRHYVYAGSFFDREWTDGSDWDYYGIKQTAGAQFTFPYEIKANLDYSHKRTLYDNENSQLANIFAGFSKRRRDDNNTVSFIVSREMLKGLVVSAEYLYNRNRSNLATFDYEKNLFSLGMTWKY